MLKDNRGDSGWLWNGDHGGKAASVCRLAAKLAGSKLAANSGLLVPRPAAP